MTRHPPISKHEAPESTTPVWVPVIPDPDLQDASEENPALRTWISALASQAAATMEDNREEQLYGQAPDALRQTGIDPTAEAIETWVNERGSQLPS